MDLSTCVNHVWRDKRNRWKRGCEKVGSKRNPVYECALKTNTEGLVTLKGKCLPSTPIECKMNRSRLSSNQDFDFIYE